MADDDIWGRFRRWRRRRPFWGGLVLVLSGLELFYTANMDLGDLQIHIGPQGFLSYLLPLLLLVTGVLSWLSPAQRHFYSVIGLLAALYSFVGLNLGGFVLGMILGIVGGALVLAWGPPRTADGAIVPPAAEPADTEWGADARPGTPLDLDATQRIEIAPPDDSRYGDSGYGDARYGDALRHASQQTAAEAAPRHGSAWISKNPKAMAIGLILLVVTGVTLVIGSRVPASADEECPAGLPSRTTTATAPARQSVKTKTTKTPVKAPAAPGTKATAAPTTKASASAAPSTSAGGTGNPLVDGFNHFIDGVGDLLGIGDKASPTPSAEPTKSTEPTKKADPTQKAEPGASAEPSKSTGKTTEATGTAAPTPRTSAEVIPCLGPRMFGLTASAEDIPQVSAKPGTMEVGSLTMYDSTYDGVVDMPTANGTLKALKFSMNKAVNEPFTLTIDEPNGGQTTIKSNKLTTDGRVKFYTPEFKGNLFGVIPVTYTPEHPPPLTLPILWFTNAKIKLAYVRCDTLTADPMKLTETR